MAHPKSRTQRRLVFTKAQLRRGDEWSEVTIANVSSTGLMVKGTPVPPVHSVVEIRRRGLSISGEVFWATGTRFGIRALEPIDVDQLLAESGLQVCKADDGPLGIARLWPWRRSGG